MMVRLFYILGLSAVAAACGVFLRSVEQWNRSDPGVNRVNRDGPYFMTSNNRVRPYYPLLSLDRGREVGLASADQQMVVIAHQDVNPNSRCDPGSCAIQVDEKSDDLHTCCDLKDGPVEYAEGTSYTEGESLCFPSYTDWMIIVGQHYP